MMSHRLFGNVAGAILVVGLFLGSGGIAVASSAPVLTAVPIHSAVPVDDLSACVAGGGTADILLLIDESGSLRESDPALARVTSATYFVEQLAHDADAAGVDINVQVSVFGDTYSSVLPFLVLNGASLPTVRSTIAGVASRINGVDTDYWTALDGARKDLAGQASSRPGASCQSIVWFTDGELDYMVRSSAAQRSAYGVDKPFAPGVQLTSAEGAEQVNVAATSDLCRDGGLADQVRASGIRVFGVGLNGQTSDPGDFDFLESLATGTSAEGTMTCGALRDPVPGEFTLASDLDGLLFAFDVAGLGVAPITQETGICQVVACINEAHTFVLDASTADVRILATADVGGLETALSLPDGQVVWLVNQGVGQASSIAVDGMTLTYTWRSDRTISIDLALQMVDSPAWTGRWYLAFTDPAGMSSDKTSTSNIHISGQLLPVWKNSADIELRAGEVIDGLQFGVAGRAGAVADINQILGDVTYTVTMQDSAGAVTTVLETADKQTVADLHSVNLDGMAVGAGIATLAMTVTTASVTLASGEVVPGTTLEPSIVALPITLLAPPAFPTVGAQVHFGEVTGPANVTTTLTVAGAGCVWLPTTSTLDISASPGDLGVIAITSPDATSQEGCWSSSGDGVGFPLRLSTENGGNGSIVGTVTVMTAPADRSAEPVAVQVSFTASLERPINTTNFLVTLLVALVLGPGIPLLLVYGFKRAVSKIPPRGLIAALVDVTVNEQVLRDGEPFSLVPGDLNYLVDLKKNGVRRVLVHGVELRVRVGLAPGGVGYVEVLAQDALSASDAHPAQTRHGRARLPVAVHDHWVVIVHPGAAPGQASVLVLLGADSTVAAHRELEADINRNLPALYALVVERMPDRLVPEQPGAGIQGGLFGDGELPNSHAGYFASLADQGPLGTPSASAPPSWPTPDLRADDPTLGRSDVSRNSNDPPWGT